MTCGIRAVFPSDHYTSQRPIGPSTLHLCVANFWIQVLLLLRRSAIPLFYFFAPNRRIGNCFVAKMCRLRKQSAHAQKRRMQLSNGCPPLHRAAFGTPGDRWEDSRTFLVERADRRCWLSFPWLAWVQLSLERANKTAPVFAVKTPETKFTRGKVASASSHLPLGYRGRGGCRLAACAPTFPRNARSSRGNCWERSAREPPVGHLLSVTVSSGGPRLDRHFLGQTAHGRGSCSGGGEGPAADSGLLFARSTAPSFFFLARQQQTVRQTKAQMPSAQDGKLPADLDGRKRWLLIERAHPSLGAPSGNQSIRGESPPLPRLPASTLYGHRVVLSITPRQGEKGPS